MGLVLEPMEQVDFDGLNAIADLHPLVAKRHYHQTGALRWYELTIGSLSDLQRNPENYRSNRGEAGTSLLSWRYPGSRSPWGLPAGRFVR